MKRHIVTEMFLVVFILLSFRGFLYGEEPTDCVKLSGSYIFRESPDEGKKEAIRLALAKGIIDVLSKKIPLQFLRAKYSVIRKEFIDRAGEFVLDNQTISEKVKGHHVYVNICVKWDENLITRRLEELSIVPAGILPPPLKLELDLSNFPFPVSREEITGFFRTTISRYSFPITSQNFKYLVRFYSSRVTNEKFPLYVTPETVKFFLLARAEDGKFEKGLDFELVYPFFDTSAVKRKVEKLLPELLEYMRLDWFKNLKKLSRFSFLVPHDLIARAMKIYTLVVKNSARTSLLRIGKYTDEGLWLVVYHTDSFSNDDVVEEINSVIARLNLKLVSEGSFYKIESTEE